MAAQRNVAVRLGRRVARPSAGHGVVTGRHRARVARLRRDRLAGQHHRLANTGDGAHPLPPNRARWAGAGRRDRGAELLPGAVGLSPRRHRRGRGVDRCGRAGIGSVRRASTGHGTRGGPTRPCSHRTAHRRCAGTSGRGRGAGPPARPPSDRHRRARGRGRRHPSPARRVRILAGPAGLAFDEPLTRAIDDLAMFVAQQGVDSDAHYLGTLP